MLALVEASTSVAAHLSITFAGAARELRLFATG